MEDPTFEVTVLGGTGGPIDSNTQCFMIRPFGKGTRNFICIDGGSGLAQIANILQYQDQGGGTVHGSNTQSAYHSDPFSKLYARDMCPDKGNKDDYFNTVRETQLIDNSTQNCKIQLGFSNDFLSYLPSDNNIIQNSYMIFQGMKEYYITHPHLDHITGMIINSPLAFEENIGTSISYKGNNKFNLHKGKIIYGLPFVSSALEDHIFNDKIWPHLTNITNRHLQIATLNELEITNSKCFPQFEIIPFKICHGFEVNNDNVRIFSTVFLIRNVLNGSTILIFGDTDYNQDIRQTDGESEEHTKNLLEDIWDYLAKNIDCQKLKGIFIECSNSRDINENCLYGHLSSSHLIKELKLLNSKYLQYQDQSIDELNIFITHIKMIPSDIDPRKVIIHELRESAKDEPLLKNFKFSIALNSYSFIL